MSENIVILGTGQLGLALMDEFVRAGQTVRLVNRSGKLAESLPATVTVQSADLYDPAAVRAVCAGATHVFMCAQPAYHQWPEKFPPLMESVINGLRGSGARLIFGSNLYMYGDVNGQRIHEKLPETAATRKGRARAQIAQMLRHAHASGDLPVVIGRASDFYGPRVTDSMSGDMLFAAALQGKTVNLVGDLDAPHTQTYIRDFARALIVLARDETAYGEVWHVPNAETVSARQFVALVEEEIGREIKTRTAGKLLMRLLGLFNPAAGEVVEMMYEFEKPFVVDDQKFKAKYGDLSTPLAAGVRETVAWYRAHLGL
jgi:nucleoside-diphosphate-sugar epimerase